MENLVESTRTSYVKFSQINNVGNNMSVCLTWPAHGVWADSYIICLVSAHCYLLSFPLSVHSLATEHIPGTLGLRSGTATISQIYTNNNINLFLCHFVPTKHILKSQSRKSKYLLTLAELNWFCSLQSGPGCGLWGLVSKACLNALHCWPIGPGAVSA